MKRLLLKMLCSVLVAATLLPLVVACDNDPDDGDKPNPTPDGDSTPTAYIDAVKTGSLETMIVDFESSELTQLSSNKKLSQQIDGSKGKTAVKWEVSYSTDLTVNLPSPVNIGDYYYVEFSIYCDRSSDIPFVLKFNNNAAGSCTITPDWTGWKSFRVIRDSFTVTSPFPAITSISLVCNDTNGDGSTTIYLSSIKASSPVFELTTSEGVDVNSSEYYDKILTLYKEYNIGGSEKSSLSEYTTSVKNLISSCKTSWELFKSTNGELDKSDTLFGIQVTDAYESGYGNPHKCGTQIRNVYNHIKNMAIGYAIDFEGNEYYQNEELLADIITALEYGYTHYYGATIVETRQLYGDWYCWHCSIPQYLNTTLVMIREHLTSEQITKYLSPHKTIQYWPYGYGSNRLTMALTVLVASALEKDALRLASTNRIIESVFYYQDEFPEDYPCEMGDGGVYSDGSFIQHTSVPYTGSYGVGLLNGVATYRYFLQDNAFGLYFEEADNMYEWVFNNYRPVIFGRNLTASLLGRAISSATESYTGIQIMQAALVMSTYAPNEYKDELLKFVKTVMVAGESASLKYMPLCFVQLANDIYTNDDIKPETDYEIAKVFGNMDRIVQQNSKYGVCIALSSTRITKYESINDANETGWYHGDGMIYIYTDGYDYGQHYYNWYANPYLMPGTTVNLSQRKDGTIYPQMYNSSPYAGGVEQGKYATAGYILGYNEGDYDIGSFESRDAMKISAKKSYFMFDNEIVCIGTDIKDSSGCDVVTVVENRTWGLRRGTAVEDTLYINGQKVNTPSTVETEIEARTMHFSNMGGYVFLRCNAGSLTDKDGNTVKYQKATRYPYPSINGANTEASNDFLEVTINHGVGDGNLDGKYAYVYLPSATVEETESYYADPDVSILARTGDCHAVLEKKLGIVAANFFNDNGASFTVKNASAYTGVTKVSAETPASVMIVKNADGSYTVSVSDPTQTYRNTELSISITGITQVVSKDDAVSKCEIDDGTLNIIVNTQNACGATFNITVK